MSFVETLNSLQEAVYKVAFEVPRFNIGLKVKDQRIHVILSRDSTAFHITINADNNWPTKTYSYSFPLDHFLHYNNLVQFAYTIRTTITEYIKFNLKETAT